MITRFVNDLTEILEEDAKTSLVLLGIRMFSFRQAERKHPLRAFDMGITEQNAIGFAAGLAREGIVPFVHTWSPFLIERAFDQLRLFGSQDLCGNFIGAGASYELTDFGESHYCPEDAPILKQIRNMQIIVPGTAEEFSKLFRSIYNNGHPTYYRLSQTQNANTVLVKFGKADVLQRGKKGTVLVVGPMLSYLEAELKNRDVTVLYYTTVAPFDTETLRQCATGSRLLICEPYNESAVLTDVIQCVGERGAQIKLMGFRTDMYCNLGKFDENLKEFELDSVTVKTNLDWAEGKTS